MNNKTRYFLIVLIGLLIAGVLALTIWGIIGNLSAKNNAHAEFNDLNSNSLVNFNQLIENEFIFGTSDDYVYLENVNIGDKIYFKWDNTSDDTYIYDSFSDTYILNDLINNNIFEIPYLYGDFLQLDVSNGEYYTNFNAFNLTLMFGAGNEPNLEQAKQYFTAEYYPYTTSQIMPFSNDYMTGYYQGIKDYQDNLTATFTNNVLGTIAYPLNANGFESSIGYNVQYNLFAVEGIVAVPFGDYITSPIEFNATFYYPNYAGGLYLVFFSRLGGELQPLYITTIDDGTNYQSSSATFSINNLDTIYMGVFDNNTNFSPSTNVTYYAIDTQLTIKTLDYASLLNAALGEAMSSYQEGGINYQQIYDLGYNAGYFAQNGESENNFWTFIGTSMKGISDILALELLPNIPIGTFVLFPLLIGLIFFIVKLTKGGE